MDESPDSVTEPTPTRKLVAYLIVLTGTLFYCYNFNVVSYIRPYLIDRYHFSIGETAELMAAQNIGITAGALTWASVVGWLGYRVTVATIIALMAAFALGLTQVTGFWPWMIGRGLLAFALGGFSVVTGLVIIALFAPSWRGRLFAVTFAAFPMSNIMLGTLGAAFGDAHWRGLLWVAVLPLVLVPCIWIIPQVSLDAPPSPEGSPHGGWREMLSPRWRWRTVGCSVLAGLDFNAYQLFASFLTLYLRQQRGAGPAEVGLTVSLLSAGSIAGALAWAWLSDVKGRRYAAFGYVTAGLAILVILFGNPQGGALAVMVALFGFGLSCNSAWGPWFVELFPNHLRPHGAALFHVGHLIAMLAPLLVALFVDRFGLVGTMAIAAPIYFVGAVLWFALPETIRDGELLPLPGTQAKPVLAG